MNRIKRYVAVVGVVLWSILVVGLLLTVAGNLWVVMSTSNQIVSDLDQLPHVETALVLGTSHLLVDGYPNPFFHNRMKQASLLYQTEKISQLILSGDHHSKYYNELIEMKKALIKLNVPESAMILDHEGVRTLDSVVRSKEVFDTQEMVIVTQVFHSYRALFIANYYGIDAIACPTSQPDVDFFTRVYWREYLARIKAILDLYIFDTLSPRSAP